MKLYTSSRTKRTKNKAYELDMETNRRIKMATSERNSGKYDISYVTSIGEEESDEMALASTLCAP